MKFRPIGARWAVTLVALVAISVIAVVTASAKTGKIHSKFVLGVSNTLVGNGWREEMICSVKAQAAASGMVSAVKSCSVITAGVRSVSGIVPCGAHNTPSRAMRGSTSCCHITPYGIRSTRKRQRSIPLEHFARWRKLKRQR